jgi:hypothetical protein
MPILVVAENAGATAEQDAALVRAMDLEGSPPAGARIRMADGRRLAHRESLGQRSGFRAFS